MSWSNVQSWPKVFSTSTFSLKEEERKGRTFYPDDRIKNMEDFERLATPEEKKHMEMIKACLLYTSPSPRDLSTSRMPSSA